MRRTTSSIERLGLLGTALDAIELGERVERARRSRACSPLRLRTRQRFLEVAARDRELALPDGRHAQRLQHARDAACVAQLARDREALLEPRARLAVAPHHVEQLAGMEERRACAAASRASHAGMIERLLHDAVAQLEQPAVDPVEACIALARRRPACAAPRRRRSPGVRRQHVLALVVEASRAMRPAAGRPGRGCALLGEREVVVDMALARRVTVAPDSAKPLVRVLAHRSRAGGSGRFPSSSVTSDFSTSRARSSTHVAFRCRGPCAHGFGGLERPAARRRSKAGGRAARSSSGSKSWLQSISARRVRWRGGSRRIARGRGAGSGPACAPAISSTGNARTRAAASSIASGMPSRRSQISTTAGSGALRDA